MKLTVVALILLNGVTRDYGQGAGGAGGAGGAWGASAGLRNTTVGLRGATSAVPTMHLGAPPVRLGAQVHLDSVEEEEEEMMSHEHRHHRGLVKRSDPTRHPSPLTCQQPS